jgi:hypothetical protein
MNSHIKGKHLKKDAQFSKTVLETPLLSFKDRRNYQELQEEKYLIDPHNPMQLYRGRVIDTTNQSVVKASKTMRFDPSGHIFDRPLAKDVFYTDPYITCSNCNFLNFVDTVAIRRMLSLPAVVSEDLRIAPEVLPPCVVCHLSDCFIVGSHDFEDDVKERQR